MSVSEASTDQERFTQYSDCVSRNRGPFQLPSQWRMAIDAEKVFGKHYELGGKPLRLVGHMIRGDSPMAFPLLKDNMTVWTAKVTGKKYMGRGNACSR